MSTTASFPDLSAFGIGKGPYRIVGHHESKFQAIPGDPSCPVVPGSSCAMCSQPIMQVYVVRSADGVESKLGCDCVRRTNDVTLVGQLNAVIRRARRAQAHRVAAQQEADLGALLADEATRAKLAAQPHPRSDMAARGMTLLDFADSNAANAGAAGRARALKAVRAALG